MEKLEIDGLSRAEARKLIMSLPRNEAFYTDVVDNGTKIYITTDREKQSRKICLKVNFYLDNKQFGEYCWKNITVVK